MTFRIDNIIVSYVYESISKKENRNEPYQRKITIKSNMESLLMNLQFYSNELINKSASRYILTLWFRDSSTTLQTSVILNLRI